MSLIGQGAMASWHDLSPDGESRHDDWHSHQHIAERVGIPGFHRGRRYRRVDGAPEYFLLYEVDDLSVLTSDAYQERLNHPTDWTRAIVPTVLNMCRTLCHVEASFGRGIGCEALTIRIDGSDSTRPELLDRLTRYCREVVDRPGVTAAHLLLGDAEASGVSTQEKALRDSDDRPADIAVMIEGYEGGSLRILSETDLSFSALAAQGAVREQGRGIYRLAHSLSDFD